MANLVEENYLHMNKWTFYNNLSSVSSWNVTKKSNSAQVLTNLQAKINTRKNREEQCYAEAGIAGSGFQAAQQLARRYFSGAENDKQTTGQIIDKIITSQKMRDLLTTGLTPEQEVTALKKQILTGRKKGQVAFKRLDTLVSEKFGQAIESSLDDYINALFDISPEFVGSKSERYHNVDKAKAQKKTADLLKQLLGNPDLYSGLTKSGNKSEKQALTSLSSDYKNKAKAQIRRNLKNMNTMIDNAVQLLRTELLAEAIPQEQVDVACALWRQILNADLKNDKRLTTFNPTTIGGQLDEVGLIFSKANIVNGSGNDIVIDMEFVEQFNSDRGNFDTTDILNQMTNVLKSSGAKLVDRFSQALGRENKKQSKVDTIFQPRKGGGTYYLSLKSSYKEAFSQYIDEVAFSGLDSGRVGSISLHSGNTSAKTIFTQMQAGGFLNAHEVEEMIYVLTNALVLSKYSKYDNGKIDSKKGGTGGSLEIAQLAVEKAMGRNLDFFISDFLYDGVNVETTTSADFIFINRTILVPVSLILESIYRFLEQTEKQLNGLEFTTRFNLRGYSEDQFQKMVQEKQEAMNLERREGGSMEHDYHNYNLVLAGQAAGEQVYHNHLRLGDIKLNINTKNLFSLVYGG